MTEKETAPPGRTGPSGIHKNALCTRDLHSPTDTLEQLQSTDSNGGSSCAHKGSERQRKEAKYARVDGAWLSAKGPDIGTFISMMIADGASTSDACATLTLLLRTYPYHAVLDGFWNAWVLRADQLATFVEEYLDLRSALLEEQEGHQVSEDSIADRLSELVHVREYLRAGSFAKSSGDYSWIRRLSEYWYTEWVYGRQEDADVE